ncbi:MAG: ThuA domain-containing protein [bacterium]|nr:ThuA domain-containing protein [bacterium]
MSRIAFAFPPFGLLLFAVCLSCQLPLAPLHAQSSEESLRIVFLAGNPSHGYGAHEHLAGCRVLAEAIENAADNVQCDVYAGGWPEDDSVLEGADSIVMYCDGGGRHPALQHLDVLAKHMERGAGFVCLHYAVEVPPDQGGKEFLQWLGGYFEINWSVNPHWTADYNQLPKHPVASGVQPFSAHDEWYFHMRFQPDMRGVTPILSAVAPEKTMTRQDGPHSGNPDVRRAVAAGEPQHTAWVYERPGGGRSFGFTGGHFHWNWGREEFLRLVSNAIVWTAGGEIPGEGLQVMRPTAEQLADGQDEKQPKDFALERIQQEFQIGTE